MNRQRFLILTLLVLAFVGVSVMYFANAWRESSTRFRTGLPIPNRILPPELRDPGTVIPAGPPTLPPLRSDDPVLYGTPGRATVSLVVFGDFQCEFCRNQAAALSEALGIVNAPTKVSAVWRDLPITTQHPRALAAAAAGQCAARQGRFAAMHDALFFQGTDLSDAQILSFASQVGLRTDDFLTCLRDPAIPFRLNQDLQTAREHAILSVPLLFVNGQPIDGYVDAQTLTAIIQSALGQTPQ